jgi:hypothetical protein
MDPVDASEEDHVLAAAALHAEAAALLRSTGLLTLLGRYGDVYATGSYAYNLMTWRDIDLCVTTDNLDLPTVFQLGVELAELPNVGSMYYRNELVLGTPGNPRAIFWCVDFCPPDGEQWKVDILLGGSEEVAQVLLPGQRLRQALTWETREVILRIKGVVCRRPEYRQQYGSQAIYRAVMEDQVKTVEQWDAWWANQPV